jgi:hypothetical protein
VATSQFYAASTASAAKGNELGLDARNPFTAAHPSAAAAAAAAESAPAASRTGALLLPAGALSSPLAAHALAAAALAPVALRALVGLVCTRGRGLAPRGGANLLLSLVEAVLLPGLVLLPFALARRFALMPTRLLLLLPAELLGLAAAALVLTGVVAVLATTCCRRNTATDPACNTPVALSLWLATAASTVVGTLVWSQYGIAAPLVAALASATAWTWNHGNGALGSAISALCLVAGALASEVSLSSCPCDLMQAV